MTGRDILHYLRGDPGAIQRVAGSEAALPTGALLVLLTSVPRNYDQIHVSEQPVLWFLEPLLFSLVSGTWLYLCAFWWLGKLETDPPSGAANSDAPSEWPAFMGLFWLTAPIAWLYAIPVERFLEPVAAAVANVLLLCAVALWRVALMVRVHRVLYGSSSPLALALILMAASSETVVALLFSMLSLGSDTILDRMAGVLSSPEVNLRREAASLAFGGALIVLPVAFLASLSLGLRQTRRRLPVQLPDRMPWATLVFAATLWSGLAFVIQPQVGRSAEVEALARKNRFREALDYLAARQPEDFAPSRVLPPRLHGWNAAHEISSMLAVAREADPVWVREHLVHRLNELIQLYGHWIEGLVNSFRDEDRALLIKGLQAFPEGRAWANSHDAVLAKLTAEPDGW